MDFVELTKRFNRSLYDSCEREALTRVGRALEQADGLKGLLEGNDPSLLPFPAARVWELGELHRALTSWKEGVRDLRKILAVSGLKLPDGAMTRASSPQELSALERAARMCQRSLHPDHDAWSKALDAHMDLWRAGVEIATSRGFVQIGIVQPDHPDAEQFASLATAKTEISELRGYKWLAARRGERGGIVSIGLILPKEEIREQAEARLPALGLAAQKRGAESILEELVWNNLEAVVRVQLDSRAESEACRTAGSAYLGLLTTAPLRGERILAVYVGSSGSPAGMAVLDKAGAPMASRVVSLSDDLPAAVGAYVADHSPEGVAFPVSADDTARLSAALEAVGELPTVRVHRGGLHEAKSLLEVEFPSAVAAAVVMGRRAQRPMIEFGKVPPASLGLGEYSSDLDPERLDAVLSEARLIAEWERRNRRKAAAAGGPGSPKAQVARALKRLNPLVKTVRDLRPGMVVEGVITNLTRFGAFVNIGLSTEAMIHVSQLSTEFVDEPSQVVRIGQTVSARVLEVIPEKSRIALSLKPAPVPGERPPLARRESGGQPLSPMIENAGGPRNSASGSSSASGGEKKSRTAALADLHALFKK